MSTPPDVALTYNGYVTQLCTLAIYNFSTIGGVVTPSDAFVQALIPQMLNYAELRIQRDLDFLQSLTTNTTYSLTSNTNILTMDVNSFITLQSWQYTSGTANLPILPTSKEFIQNVFNDSSSTGPPQYVAPYGGDAATTGATSQLWLFGPYADQTYALTILGTARMLSLNNYNTNPVAGTTVTFVSAYLPDLLIMASMIYLSGAQRNFGRASDDPQMAVTYESQYQALLKGAAVEEARRKFQASGWTSMSVPVAATAER